MASTDIDHWQPVSNPAAVASTASTASTPGLDLPGSYLPDANERSDAAANRRDALDHLSDAASPNTVSSVIQDSREAAAQYLPTREGVQHAFADGVDSMRDYLPGRVVGALGSELPGKPKDTPTFDAQTDPASTVKPTSISLDASTNTDNASMTALAPSTRSPSSMTNFFTDFSKAHVDTSAGENVNGETSTVTNENDGTAGNLDTHAMSTVNPVTSNASNAPSTPAARVPNPGSERDLPSSNKAGLPTPPPSPPATPSAPASSSSADASAPRPPPKDGATEPVEQPDHERLAASPAQAHVKGGAGVSVAAMGGAEVPSTNSLGSTTSAGPSVPNGKGASSGDEEGAGDDEASGKKEGKAHRLVGRVKDKMHHWGH
ncbi:hypothetical protein DFH11DRAFT_1773557 [Phellopilus nigrolimitatus]|nr:hypothetical protein DFH11DRAFT_1773557 [Phellopilus nigrolimitatus]